MTADEPPRPLRALAGMAVFLPAANAAVVAIHALMMPYRSGGGMFFGWLLCLTAIAIAAGVSSKAAGGGGGGLFVPVLLFAIFSCVYGIVGGQLPRLLILRETPVLSVAEADRPEYESSHVFHFSGGQVLRRYHWTRRISRKMSAAGFYHVAPVVPDGWKPSDPVTLWAVGEGTGLPSDAWKNPVSGGYREISDATYRDMIERGLPGTGLVSAPRAPLVVLDDHPREALQKAARFELGWLLAANVGSLVALLVPLVRRKRDAA